MCHLQLSNNPVHNMCVNSCTNNYFFARSHKLFPEAMLSLARGVFLSRSFSTSASVSVRVYNAPKKFRPKEEEKEVKVKVPKGDLRGEVPGYREERIVLPEKLQRKVVKTVGKSHIEKLTAMLCFLIIPCTPC